MRVLVTGGAGFIGSHTVVELLNEGFEVVVIDNLSNASEEALKRVEEITGKKVDFYKADVRDRVALEEIFKALSINIHTRSHITVCTYFASGHKNGKLSEANRNRFGFKESGNPHKNRRQKEYEHNCREHAENKKS